MLLMKGDHLAARDHVGKQLAERSGLHGLGIVAHVGS